MADFQKMYAVLCAAVDDVIGPLEKIPMAMQPVRTLREALLRAEDIYMDTSMYAEKDENGNLLRLVRESAVENQYSRTFSMPSKKSATVPRPT